MIFFLMPILSVTLIGRRDPPPDATQEQYDRWLAFQLAQTEDDISAAEFNKRHRPIIGRSQSMPEREVTCILTTIFVHLATPKN